MIVRAVRKMLSGLSEPRARSVLSLSEERRSEANKPSAASQGKGEDKVHINLSQHPLPLHPKLTILSLQRLPRKKRLASAGTRQSACSKRRRRYQTRPVSTPASPKTDLSSLSQAAPKQVKAAPKAGVKKPAVAPPKSSAKAEPTGPRAIPSFDLNSDEPESFSASGLVSGGAA